MGQIPPKPMQAGRRVQTGRRIYQKLRSQIADGTFPAGSRLPSTRALAAELGVSRTTVTTVYEQLAAEGYLETSQRARARVAPGVTPLNGAPRNEDPGPREARTLSAFGRRVAAFTIPPSLDTERPPLDFLYGSLASTDFPTLAWRRAYSKTLLQRQARLSYADPRGEAELRTQLRGYLQRARGLVCDPDQIVIVHGSQQGIDLCARVLIDRGDRVVIEDPCYRMARLAFEAAGATLLDVPVDEHGLVTDRLPSGRRVRLAYVTPSHQFPLGAVMSVARRQDLLAWANRRGAYVIEDDYDGEFRYGVRPIDALQSIDALESVIYVGTFSKALSPQMRLGYLVLPRSLVSVFRSAKAVTDRHAPRLEQLALASLIRTGAYERHVRRVRRENERRRTALLLAISRYLPKEVEVEGAEAGLHLVLWWKHVPKRDEQRLAAAARENGVGIYPISGLYVDDDKHRRHDCAGVILGYASLAPEQIERGVRTLRAVVARMKADRRRSTRSSPLPHDDPRARVA
jgi:GntR family transcriptional regulator/MocR family aminotransferase